MMEQSFLVALLKTALALGVVILVIFLVSFLIKKTGGGLLVKTGKVRTIKILDRQFLAPKQYLAHIEWENHMFLIGVSQNQFFILKEIEKKSKDNDTVVAKGT